MNGEKARREVIEYWMEKAGEALNSASAVLLGRGKKFSKHSGVRAAIHRSLVKKGEIDTSWGKFYDLIFNSRQRGDYQELVNFSSEETEELITLAEGFVSEMTNLMEI